MVVNVMVFRAMVVTQSEDRSIIYFATVLANEIYNSQAPAMLVKIIAVKAIQKITGRGLVG
jgi:hypothetical protein